jgi:hypothetical protein
MKTILYCLANTSLRCFWRLPCRTRTMRDLIQGRVLDDREAAPTIPSSPAFTSSRLIWSRRRGCICRCRLVPYRTGMVALDPTGLSCMAGYYARIILAPGQLLFSQLSQFFSAQHHPEVNARPCALREPVLNRRSWALDS